LSQFDKEKPPKRPPKNKRGNAMPRPTTQLTDTAITNAKPRDKKYKLYDGGGLFLLVMPTGSKLWRVKYRFKGKEKEYAIGTYPIYTLSKARAIRDEIKRTIADGIDPNEKKKQEKQKQKEEVKLTAFEQKTQLHLVVDEWLALHEKKVTDYTAKKTRALLYEKLYPHLANPQTSIISRPPHL